MQPTMLYVRQVKAYFLWSLLIQQQTNKYIWASNQGRRFCIYLQLLHFVLFVLYIVALIYLVFKVV